MLIHTPLVAVAEVKAVSHRSNWRRVTTARRIILRARRAQTDVEVVFLRRGRPGPFRHRHRRRRRCERLVLRGSPCRPDERAIYRTSQWVQIQAVGHALLLLLVRSILLDDSPTFADERYDA